MPKMLRPYFLHNRKLLGNLCRAAWETAHELMAEAVSEESRLRPGMVAVVHTAGSFLTWHPHIHALVSRGGWSRDGTWVPVPYVDMRAAELLFRHKILAFLKDEGLISDERIKLLLSWRNSGISVDCSVRIQTGDTKALERVARYILRPPFSLKRLSWDKATDQVSYTAKIGSSPSSETRHFDPLDFLARVIMTLPPPAQLAVSTPNRSDTAPASLASVSSLHHLRSSALEQDHGLDTAKPTPLGRVVAPLPRWYHGPAGGKGKH